MAERTLQHSQNVPSARLLLSQPLPHLFYQLKLREGRVLLDSESQAT